MTAKHGGKRDDAGRPPATSQPRLRHSGFTVMDRHIGLLGRYGAGGDGKPNRSAGLRRLCDEKWPEKG